MKSHVQVAVIGGGVVGCSVLYHLTKAGWKDVVLIERERADLRLDLARGGRLPHAERRSERRQAAGLYGRPLQGDREDLRPVLRAAPDRRPAARRHAGAARLAQDGACARPLSRHGDRDHLRRGSQGAACRSSTRSYFVGAHVGSDRGPSRSLRHHACLCEVGAHRRRRDLPAQPRHRARPRTPTAPGTSSPSRARSTPSMSSMPAACGRARSAAWSGSSCRCSPWSTITS